MSFLADLHVADARLGGKARSLVQLAEHGLETPPGFVVTDVLFRALCPDLPNIERLDQSVLALLDSLRASLMEAPWPAGFCAELSTRLSAVGAASYAVRSSFAGEDLPGQLAPGVYESHLRVAASDMEQTIRQVLCSALSPGAVAYALSHGQKPAKAPVAVLVHAFVVGQAEGSAAFAPARMGEPLVTLRSGQLPAEAKLELAGRLVALVHGRGPTEIEWVFHDGRLVYLQARPFDPPAPPVPWPGFDELPGGNSAQAEWRWDAAHNPLPLSPAQAGLVELVDGSCSIGIRQRVLGGYLFYTRDEGSLPPPLAAEAAGEFFALLRAQVESRLVHLGAEPNLEAALTVFVFAYEPIFGVLQPALRLAHQNLRAFLQDHAPQGLALLPVLRAGVSSMASERRELAAKMACAGSQAEVARANYVEVFGDEAPVWDVCSATYAESPDALLSLAERHARAPVALDWQAASAQVQAMAPAQLHEPWRRLLTLAREAVALGEADDWLYARTQAAVRRALLGIGKRLRAQGKLLDDSDVFYVPLGLVRDLARGQQVAAGASLATLAAKGREAWQRARGLPPPLPEAAYTKLVHGAGTGGRAIGRVFWHQPGRHSDATGMVLLAKTLLPTELPLIHAAAIVTETGGPLDHVAAQARERGIPAVVGAVGASSVFVDGDLALVDGDAGLVVKVGTA